MKTFTLALTLLLTNLAINAQQKKPFQDTTDVTQSVATKYFSSYMAMNWEQLETLARDDVSFDDPTAELLFGEKRPIGKAAVMKNFRETYASLTRMSPKLTRSFFSGNYGIFEMDLSFGFRDRQNKETTIVMPLIVVITVKDGKVLAHRDYGDYREYLRQLKAAEEKSGTKGS